jgi:hypothetical protein
MSICARVLWNTGTRYSLESMTINSCYTMICSGRVVDTVLIHMSSRNDPRSVVYHPTKGSRTREVPQIRGFEVQGIGETQPSCSKQAQIDNDDRINLMSQSPDAISTRRARRQARPAVVPLTIAQSYVRGVEPRLLGAGSLHTRSIFASPPQGLAQSGAVAGVFSSRVCCTRRSLFRPYPFLAVLY